jgi:murein L,D-transpeptidase YcbB/YkuD
MLSSLALGLAATAATASAQTDPVGASQLQPVTAPPAGQTPAPEASQALVPPAPRPLVEWNSAAAQELLSYVERIDEEGLDPKDYSPDRLRAAIESGDRAQLNQVATDVFLRTSSDLALGHVRGDARKSWYINDTDLNGGEQYAMMERAVRENSVRDTLTALLPTHPQYQELKSVLADSGKSDKAKLEKIRTNMDRWRWLPRDLGQKYVIVNVPAYMVALVEDGRVVARRRAVAGAVKTATPQLNTTISGVIFNPWWEVPKSIEGEVRGKRGYVAVKDETTGKVIRYRQPPGPSNALGRMKLVMPNNHAIFLHDTNVKGLFDKQARAYSHGCIRTEDALGFAEVLLQPTGQWDKTAIQQTIASGKSVKADLAQPIPVYITYFTAAAIADKKEIVSYKDIYSRDTPVLTALNDSGRGGSALASVSK